MMTMTRNETETTRDLATLEQTAREAQDRLAAARAHQEEAAHEDREAAAAPLRARVGQLEAEIAAVHARVQARLAELVGEARGVYRALAQLHAEAAAVRRQIQDATGAVAVGEMPLASTFPFGAFVRQALAAFDRAGADTRGPAWAREGEGA